MNGYQFSEGRGRFAEVQPGDGTRYYFAVMEDGGDNLFVAGNLCRSYWMRKESVREYGPMMAETWRGERKAASATLDHHYITYLAEGGHMGYGTNPANPWTVRAAIIAAWFALRDWDREYYQQDAAADEVAAAKTRMEDR